MIFQRVPWYEDVGFIGAALAVSTLVLLRTLLAWPVAALRRCWRRTAWSESAVDRRLYAAARLVALVDVAVIVATLTLFALSKGDLTYLTDSLDPWLVIIYVLAWLGVVGAIPTIWIAVRFWRKGAGGWRTRAHHSLIAASTAFLAWFSWPSSLERP